MIEITQVILDDESMIDEFLEVAHNFYKPDTLKHQLNVADEFRRGTDLWIIALFGSILETTRIGNYYMYGVLWKYEKKELYQYISRLKKIEHESYFDYIRRLDGKDGRVKIADLQHRLTNYRTLTPKLKIQYEKTLQILDS